MIIRGDPAAMNFRRPSRFRTSRYIRIQGFLPIDGPIRMPELESTKVLGAVMILRP